jgi:hypothetical protein
MPIIMLVLCRKRELNAIVEEFGDWQGEGVQVKLSVSPPKPMMGLSSWNGASPSLNTLMPSSKGMRISLTYSPLIRCFNLYQHKDSRGKRASFLPSSLQGVT